MSSFSGIQPESDQPIAGRISPAGNSTSQGAELFRLAQQGDRGAFGQIVQLYQDRLYNAVLRTVHDTDDARDLTQEAFTRALANIDSFRSEAQPYTWLFRIAMNLAISQLRQSGRRRTMNLGDNGRADRSDDQAANLIDRVAQANREESDPVARAASRERSEQVVAALGRIDPEYRAILVMRDVEGFDYQQMATVLDLPLGTLKSRLFRARIALKDELKNYMDGMT